MSAIDPFKAKMQAQKQQFQKQEDQTRLSVAKQVAQKRIADIKAKGAKQLQKEHLEQIKIILKQLSERETDKHPVEYYDARERESKARWHYSRVGKNKNASFKKGIENDYKAQLLRKGVTDSNGNQKPLERKLNQFKQQPFVYDHEKKASHGTRVLHGVSFREELSEREAVSDEKFGRATHWYRQHLNRYHIFLRNGDLAKAEAHRKKAIEYKRRSYVALDNPEKQFKKQ